MITCSKTYRDIPLSHRQPFHKGRCSRLHGHSWALTLTFGAEALDERLDHGIVLCQDDPLADQLKGLEQSGLLKITWVKSASCEGIAQFLFETFGPLVSEKTEGRARLLSVHLEEDSKNSALFRSQSEK